MKDPGSTNETKIDPRTPRPRVKYAYMLHAHRCPFRFSYGKIPQPWFQSRPKIDDDKNKKKMRRDK